MSSYDGSAQGDEGAFTNPALQLAPRGAKGPNFSTLKEAFQGCMTSLGPTIDQCRENFRTRYAIWDGQSSDGRKHAREGGKIDPTPWDGASDLRVFLTDEAINSKVSMLCTAFRRATLTATPIEGNDLERAQVVSQFLRWLMLTQIPDLNREVRLLANYLQEQGFAATGQFWQTSEQKVLQTVRLEDFQAQFPNMDVISLLFDESSEDGLIAIFEEIYGCTKAKARRMLKELRENQETTVAVVGRAKSFPVIRAFSLSHDLFIPDSSTDIENATGIYRVQYFTPEQLRSFVNTDGWNEAWVEQAIERLRGQYVTLTDTQDTQPQSRSFIYIEQRMTQLIGVVYAYQKLSDEDGVPGIYCTIFSPLLPPGAGHDGYAKYSLLDYAHGQYPFTLHKREFLSRKLHDSRGIPEPGLPWQQQIKVHKDSRIDAASMAILPPMGYPIGRPPVKWGAGARVPERRPGEYHYLDRPLPDMNTEKSEQLLSDSFNRYNGFVSRETDPTFAALKNRDEVENWLESWKHSLWQVYKLWQQFGSEETYFRVVGLRTANPMLMQKGDPTEDFDLSLTFDVDSLDREIWAKKLETILKIASTADPEGITNWGRLTQFLYQTVDPNIAEQIVDPKEVAQKRFVEEEAETLSQVFAGFDSDIKVGSPAELGLQIIQQYAQVPDVAQRLQTDEAFRMRLEKRAKQYAFAIEQRKNAQIGRMGAGPVDYGNTSPLGGAAGQQQALPEPQMAGPPQQ